MKVAESLRTPSPPSNAATSAADTLLSLLECALTKNKAVNPLGSALTKSLDLKSRRISSYKKWGGGRGFPPFSRQLLRGAAARFILGRFFSRHGAALTVSL